MGERSGQVKSMFTQGQGRFNQTAIWLTPTGEQDEPVLDNREEEFGEDFGEDLPGVLSAPGIQGQGLLPQFEKEFNLPTQTQEDQGFGRGQGIGRKVGNDDRPVTERQCFGAQLVTAPGRLLTDVLPTLRGDVGRNPLGNEATSKALPG